ncbi:MAG: ribonuclease P protein subunit [Candidatus Nitrosotenuis sp.]
MIGNIINQEFIGLQTQVVESANKALIGLSGKIVDETKFMFVLETQNGTKMIPKQHNHWKFAETNQIIDGDVISKRPEDRIKVKA